MPPGAWVGGSVGVGRLGCLLVRIFRLTLPPPPSPSQTLPDSTLHCHLLAAAATALPAMLLLQPFNSPEEALGEPSMQQVRDGVVREMLHFNPEIEYAQLPMMVQYR